MSLILNGTTGISDVDGTAAAPALTGTDTNTGIFFPAADTIAFAEGGAEAMRIDSSGNVGIGTSSPTASSNNKTLTLNSPATFGSLVDFKTNETLNFRIFSGVSNSVLSVKTATPLLFDTNDTERMRIDSSGNLNINGTANNGAKVNIYCTDNSANALNAQVFSNGNNAFGFKNASGSQVGSITINASTTSFNTSSDYRLKNTIAPMTGALAKVALLKPCTYKWNVDGSDGQGFIAHELDEVVPGCVTGEKDAVEEQEYEVTPAVKDEEGNTIIEAVMGTRTVPKYQGIDTSFLVATLTAAIQEQQALIQALTSRITALEAA